MKSKKKRERRTTKFKELAVQRMLAGEPISELSRELKVRRTLLYRWRDAYRQEEWRGFVRWGDPGGVGRRKAQQAEARIAEMERMIGQQAIVMDFLQRAFKRAEGSRQPSRGGGETASMGRSKP